MKSPAISVITVNWNGKDDLAEFYQSLYKQTFKNFEAILVDNGSSDGSKELVKKKFPEVKIIELDKNYGFAEPNNIGFRHAKGKYIVTLNNDLVLTSDFLEELYNCAEKSDETIFSIGAKMIFHDEPQLINSVAIKPLKNGNGINVGKNEDPKLYSKQMVINGPCAGAALYKKSVIDKIGFFDGRYFAYLEDLDLTLRANRYGYSALFCPSAIVYHKHSKTSAKFPFFKLYLIERNRLLNLVKHKNFFWLLIETPMTAYYVLSHLFNKDKKSKVSKNQKAYFEIKNIFKIMQIYIKARIYLVGHYVEFRKHEV
jgi:GT2 family glycosyltransferase